MARETEFAKNRVKKTTPLAVFGFKKVELDRNMIANVHRLQNGKRSRLWSIEERVSGAGL
jgi:hypothetical protein